MKQKDKVLITGIGGASLGTEILKSLLLADRYKIYGCDISKFAYGHYQKGFIDTFVVDSENYISSILKICKKSDIDFIIPGGEKPTLLINESREIFKENGIQLVINSHEIIKTFTNKYLGFKKLEELGFKIPLTRNITDKNFNELYNILDDMNFPCIVKPVTGTGGSVDTFIAGNKKEAILYIEYLKNNNKDIIVQEYISEKDGEFTVGVVSLPNRKIISSIAMKRIFGAKLSVRSENNYGIISSGYSQGLIDEFPEICKVSENIAMAIKSEGPINIQGRAKDGDFIPFEINPRFSASTYLRALAGINEIDMYLQHFFARDSDIIEKPKIHTGYYFRSLSETFVDKNMIKDANC